jgi:hypothetical protein
MLTSMSLSGWKGVRGDQRWNLLPQLSSEDYCYIFPRAVIERHFLWL